MSIDHILQLARLEISEKEKKEIEKEFSLILDFVKTLDEVEINKEEIKKQKKELQNIVREDEQKISNSQFLISKKLIEMAPETKDRYIKTKQIL